MNMPWKNQTATPARPASAIVDELGEVKAKIAALEKRESELKELLGPFGKGEFSGQKCIAVVTESSRESFQSKDFKADHPDWAAKYTKSTPVTTIRIKALV